MDSNLVVRHKGKRNAPSHLQVQKSALINSYAASAAEIFETASPSLLAPCLVVVIYSSMGYACPLPCTSSSTAAVDECAAGPSLFPFHLSQKCLGFE